MLALFTSDLYPGSLTILDYINWLHYFLASIYFSD